MRDEFAALVRPGPLVVAIAVALLGVCLVPGVATAQQAAGIIGQVTDEGGGVLPGVTVTASSPSLQVPEVTVTSDGRGEYRLTPLPIGTYSIAYTLLGFQGLRRQEVRLTVGFVARVDVVMKVGALEETVTVTGASPIVDVTSTGTRAAEFTKETLELIPSSRYGLDGLLSQTPGVRTNLDVGGSSVMVGSGPIFRVFGQTGDSWQSVEGVVVVSPKNTQSGNYFDYAALEEARLQTAANDAEMPQRGIQLVAIVKSGGNDFHGDGYWSQTNDRFQSDNIDDALAAQGIGAGGSLQTRWDMNGDLGGRLVREKLWFYGAVNAGRDRVEVLGAFKPDGSAATNDHIHSFYTQKYSYQMNPQNRFVAFHQFQNKHFERDVTQFLTWETRAGQRLQGNTAKGEWQSVPTSSLALSLQFGYWNWTSSYVGRSPAVPKVDLFTQLETGNNFRLAGESAGESTYHSKGSATWYRSDLFVGNHEFKAGFDYLMFGLGRSRYTTDTSNDYQLVYNNGVATQIRLRNNPVEPTTQSHYLGVFAKDNWIIGRRLTIGLGLRYAHDNGFVPEQCREAGRFAVAQCWQKVQFKVWKSVAPRVHFALDITGSGRTVLKGGWGRFDHVRQIDPEVIQANSNVQTQTTYRWRDLNGNADYDPGEVNLDPNGPDFVSISGTSNAVANPNEKQPQQDEFSISLERELRPNLAVRAMGIYSRATNPYRLQNNRRPYESYNVPVTRPDPGPDGTINTADDPGAFFTYYEYPVALRGLAFEEGMLINVPGDEQAFTSYEFSMSRRLANGWNFDVSHSATKKDIPFPNQGSNLPGHNPNSGINTADLTWEWLSKANASYVFPRNIVASAAFEHRSGTQWTRQVLFAGGTTIPNQVVNVEPLNSNRLSSVNIVNLRAEKRFVLLTRHRLSLRVNLYNALNTNTTLAVNARSGPTFGRTTSIVTPRIVELSAAYTF